MPLFGRRKEPRQPWPDFDEDTDMHKIWNYQPNLQAYVGGAHLAPVSAAIPTVPNGHPQQHGMMAPGYTAYPSAQMQMQGAMDPAMRAREAQMARMAQHHQQQQLAQQQHYDKHQRKIMKHHLKAAKLANGKRLWHAIAGRAISTIATILAIGTEVLFVMR
jgi:hypothetical protein